MKKTPHDEWQRLVSDAGDLVLSAGKGFLVQHLVTKFAAESVGRVEGVDVKRIQ